MLFQCPCSSFVHRFESISKLSLSPHLRPNQIYPFTQSMQRKVSISLVGVTERIFSTSYQDSISSWFGLVLKSGGIHPALLPFSHLLSIKIDMCVCFFLGGRCFRWWNATGGPSARRRPRRRRRAPGRRPPIGRWTANSCTPSVGETRRASAGGLSRVRWRSASERTRSARVPPSRAPRLPVSHRAVSHRAVSRPVLHPASARPGGAPRTTMSSMRSMFLWSISIVRFYVLFQLLRLVDRFCFR